MSNTDVSTDNEVIERSADEPGAFALLFDRHAPAIYRYAAQRLGEGSAEDVMSETFLVAFEKRAAYDLAIVDARPWLFGIATRNGILLISHYRYLMEHEGLGLREAVIKGSLERLRPVVMTALAAGLALVPFAIAAQKPGNEILSPLAVVILGGLVSATVLNMLVLPVLYLRYGGERANH